MKKTLTKVLGALTLVSALFFVGCSDITQGSMSGDTILSLEAPKVTAIAYPGQIQATWTKVSDAYGYDVQVLADGQELVASAYSVSNDKITIGTSVNAIEYTIRVSARSDAAANPARAVSVLDSKYGEAKVKAIVPPAGTSALQLAAYESGYDGKVKTAKDVLTADKIRVTQDKNDLYVSIQAKCYLNYQITLVDEYGVLTNTISTTANSITKNDQWIEKKISNTSYGKKTLAVKVTAANNSTLYPEDKVTGETYTYTEFSYGVVATGTSVSAAYVDNIRAEGEGAKNAVRLTWTPATYEGKPVPVDMYKVYRRSAYSNELVEVTKAEEKDEEGNVTSPAVVVKVSDLTSETNNTVTMYDAVKYYIDTEVEDATIQYTYYVVVAKDDSIANASATLAPKAADYVTLVASPAKTVEGTVENTKYVNDARVDDIKWTITLANKYQTFEAYALSKDWNKDSKGYNITPVAEDFDTTTDLAADATTTDGTTFTLVQNDVTDAKYFLMVIVKQDGFKSKKVISGAATVANNAEPSMTNASLKAVVYDATLNESTTSDVKVNKNDVKVTFVDKIDTTKESLDSYTYKLYKAEYAFDVNAAGTKVYGSLVGKFEEVEGFKVVVDSNPSEATADTKTVIGTLTLADVAVGKYIYKVVKTNVATGKYSETPVTFEIADPSKDSINASASKQVVVKDADGKWIPGSELAANRNVEIELKLANLVKAVYADAKAELAGAPASYEDLYTGVSVALYKVETTSDGATPTATEVNSVYTKVDATFAEDADEVKAAETEYTPYTYDAATDTYKDGTAVKLVPNRTLRAYVVEPTTTALSYDYVIVVSKAGYDDVIVTGINY